MPLDLDDTERAALIELLKGEVENTRYPLAPRTTSRFPLIFSPPPHEWLAGH